MHKKWFLVLSLVLNGALLLVLQFGFRTSSARPEKRTVEKPSFLTSQATKSPAELGPQQIQRKRKKSAFHLGKLEAEDYPTFIAKLRAAGLSEDSIALLVDAGLSARPLPAGVAVHREMQLRSFARIPPLFSIFAVRIASTVEDPRLPHRCHWMRMITQLL